MRSAERDVLFQIIVKGIEAMRPIERGVLYQIIIAVIIYRWYTHRSKCSLYKIILAFLTSMRPIETGVLYKIIVDGIKAIRPTEPSASKVYQIIMAVVGVMWPGEPNFVYQMAVAILFDVFWFFVSYLKSRWTKETSRVQKVLCRARSNFETVGWSFLFCFKARFQN